ncbi:sulfotransferase [Haloechinothrix sp. LS1_15]|uniref:sulfotransferase family protein n=1 Tax=Haloechinothrix sp. LS1_15 TaxID=2652248 RepID=UPI0029486836|nr:sulfotransferase [Haloechinothrix sp. LS1_15]MDV6011675.1 sulfotransferase [Haloechinothrix sp. LS1_15]
MTSTTTALRVDDLLTAARDKVGLTEFGDDWFLEPLGVLISALNDEARLSEPGLEMTRRRLVALLGDRLRMRALQRQHPEILDVEPAVAAEICGLPRTGSTLLQRLLASSPKLTSTLSWETSYPIPFPGEGPDAPERKRRAQDRMRMFLEYSPDFGDIHTIEWDGPEEDVILMDRTFTSMSFESFYHVPSYGDWLRAADQSKAYAELRQWLQILQWQQPERDGKRWALKSPHHLTATGTLLDTFDGCTIVMTHRSPARAVPSYASMVHNLFAQYSDATDPHTIGPYWRDRFASALRNFATVREQRPERFVDVPYQAMLREPVNQALRVLDELGLVPDEADKAAFEEYMERDRQQRHAAHSYTAEDYGLTEQELERDFAFYTAEYL